MTEGNYLDRLRAAIKKYNMYRSPEATARLVTRRGDVVYVEFDGTYCETCGLYDWIDDLRYVAEELGLKLEAVNIKEPEGPEGSRRIAKFKVVQGDNLKG